MIKQSLLLDTICLGLVLSQLAIASSFAIPSAIQKQLDLPENQIDIGIAALTFAKEFYPALDIAAYSKQLDLLADKARLLANGSQEPERRIRVLNTVLRDAGYRYDKSPFARSKQEQLHNAWAIPSIRLRCRIICSYVTLIHPLRNKTSK